MKGYDDPKAPLEGQRYQQRASIVRFVGTGAVTTIFLPKKPRRFEDIDVYQAGVWLEPNENGVARGWGWDGDRKVTLTAAPGAGVRVVIKVQGV